MGCKYKQSGGSFNDLICRGLFIISDKGIVRHASVNDVEVGRSIDEIYRLVLGFRYTDKHGEGKYLNLTAKLVVIHYYSTCKVIWEK